MKKQVGSLLFDKLNVFQIFGANTGVGKTVASTALAKNIRDRKQRLLYLKPVQTGSDRSADVTHLRRFVPDIQHKTLFKWEQPVSPHLAARYGGPPHADGDILTAVHEAIVAEASDGDARWALIETAGGVLSPGPSGTLQADLYRPLRLPALLVGDSRLGGIGSTISAYESLFLRGYDVHGIILFRDQIYENSDYLVEHFRRHKIDLPIALLEPPPAESSDEALDTFNMLRYYERQGKDGGLRHFNEILQRNMSTYRNNLKKLPTRAHEIIWHPFLQHTERKPENILAIDSAYGDYFQTVTGGKKNQSLLKPAFDGSASWWTQGLGHGNPELALTAAYAAGRYGHVMFANAAHEPAVALAERLIGRTQDGRPQTTRPSRVFYSDNGSTAMEVAVKMALKASTKRYGWDPNDRIEIVGLKDSYHGDTIGAMDCSEGNIYNEKVEWYSGKGHWFDYPKVAMKKGKWVVTAPPGAEDVYGPPEEFENLRDIFDFSLRKSKLKSYTEVISKMLDHLISRGHKLGALIMEPVILGAGGMNLVDPAFQKALADSARAVHQECLPSQSFQETILTSKNDGNQQVDVVVDALDWSGIPVITDEVFTGMYRLGRLRSSSLVGLRPDISVYAKLLTGGIIPLAVTLASESIYSAFLSDDKSDALLHGHSYTAHAIGCQVALKALDDYHAFDGPPAVSAAESKMRGHWIPFKRAWHVDTEDTLFDQSKSSRPPNGWFWSMWSQDFLIEISHRDDVEGAFALGSVLAIEMKDPQGGGYASKASIGIRDKLLQGMPEFNEAVHCRVLGNVLYFMSSLTTTPETISAVQTQIKHALG
ncbi:Aminotransferase class-III-like protein 3 [Elsinoe fawcettii]|nr:Aminotransferase class-III-like protein 3 [Elsinoe fawcettii]